MGKTEIVMDQTTPLLSDEDHWNKTSSGESKSINDEQDEFFSDQNHGTFFGSTFNIMTCVIGSGVLSLPYAYKESGLLLGTILLILMTFISIYTLKLLIRCGYLTKARTYQDIAFHAYGINGTRFTKALLFINLFGTIVAFTFIIGDLMVPCVKEWSSHNHNKHLHDIVTNRNFLSGLMIVGFVAPLSFFTKLHQLERTSAIAILSVLVVLVLVLWRSIAKLVTDKHHPFPVLFNWNVVGIFQALPMIAFALGCQTQIVPIYAELKKKGQINPIIYLGNFLCSFIYQLIAFFGYLDFHSDTKDVILNNYPNGDVLATVARVSMALHVCLAFPLQLWPCRNVLDDFIFGENNPKRVMLRNIVETVGLLGTTFITAVVVPKVTIIFGYTGAICAIGANFVLPCVFYLKLMRSSLKSHQIAAAVTVAIIGVICGFVSAGMQTYGLICPPDASGKNVCHK